MTRFRNPYNFVPTQSPVLAPQGTPPHELGLQQGRPASHDRYHSELWSGRIKIKLTAETPLLFADAATQTTENKHKTFDIRRRANGHPDFPITSLKGPLRSAFEAVTNSRFGVFNGHDAPPARRMDATEGAAVVPARIVSYNGGFAVELRKGASVGWPELRTANNGRQYYAVRDGNATEPLYAAWLPRYRDNNGTAKSYALNYCNNSGGGLPSHGDFVHVWLQKTRRGNQFAYWCVTEIAKDAGHLSAVAPAAVATPHDHTPTHVTIKTSGYVFASGDNIGNKHDERVFFFAASNNRMTLTLAPDRQSYLRRRWTELILDYRAVHKRDGKRDDINEVSRHILAPDDETLTIGTLCYAAISMSNGSPDLVDGQPTVTALFPVTIGRELGYVAPRSMLEGGLLPATSLDHLSPADRVFGWVNQKGAGAHKGQLRIARIDCTTPAAQAIETFPGGLPLAILGEPKPSQARFYVGEPNGAPLASDPKTTGYFQETDAPQKRLRGRKVYPHHTAVVPVKVSYWNGALALTETQQVEAGNIRAPGQPLYREYIKRREHQNDPASAQTSQNRSIKAWIKPGTTFTASIDVINLNAAELGALVWLLSLDEGHYHRAGGGKPLGFGSVSIEINAIELKKGTAMKRDFLSLSRPTANSIAADPGCCTHWPNDKEVLTRPFRNAAQDLHGNGRLFGDIAFISAFLRSATGYTDGLPHHYPRITQGPQPNGENFRWFQRDPPGVLGALYDENDAPADQGFDT